MKLNPTLFNKVAKPILVISILFSVLCGAIAQAEQKHIKANIVRTLADQYFGGCMVLLDVNIRTIPDGLPNCGNSWVSLDCDAQYHTPAQSNAMWTSALTAFSLNKPVSVWIQDTQIVNGYCTARRIDVYQ